MPQLRYNGTNFFKPSPEVQVAIDLGGHSLGQGSPQTYQGL